MLYETACQERPDLWAIYHPDKPCKGPFISALLDMLDRDQRLYLPSHMAVQSYHDLLRECVNPTPEERPQFADIIKALKACAEVTD
jgi:hypothetical protein